MNYKYLLGSVISIPLLPIMYVQGKRIKKSIPSLPEAKGNTGYAPYPSTKVLQLMSLGESTIAGVGVNSHKEGFTGALANELALKLKANISWKVYAKSGYTAKDVRDKLLPEIKEQTADLIVIGLGANDAFELNNPRKWNTSILELIKDVKIKFNDTPIAFTNMPPIKEFPAFTPALKFTIGNLVEILGKELEKAISTIEGVYYNSEKLVVEDWIKKLNSTTKPSDFFSDGVHPSKLTYQEWGKDFANFLIKEDQAKKDLQKRISR